MEPGFPLRTMRALEKPGRMGGELSPEKDV
jgi:hypothetical protein